MPPERDQGAVDTRFALANERTLLAWARTALALLAAGGAVQQLSDLPARTPMAILLSVIGVAAAVAGGLRYHRTARALQQGVDPLPGLAPVALAAAVAAIGVVLVVVLAVA
jgi:putative membrane protein